eukprot:CAMPEP_0116005356 /NCGR_PEP_ID=MMETSP0321-20121206/1122_1 /TAXON_ID=163516 /ORGANISM="Leptocylindrus danicus var. danicus, Strain B650" /LENGTH=448 /DNA_ID=CAMNT_0003473779 /DNA_START=306 /DNA_END=1652 /DNA_ORIENTATION=+
MALIEDVAGGTNRGKQNHLLHVISRRIQVLIYNRDPYMEQAGMDLHGRNRILNMQQNDQASLRIWGAPGITQFLLYGEDLIEPYIKTYKELGSNFAHGFPSWPYLLHVILPENEELAKKVAMLSMDFEEIELCTVFSSMEFCYFYYNLIVCAAVCAEPSSNSNTDGQGRLRDTKLAPVATRRALELWSNSDVMASCGDALSPGASLSVNAMNRWGPQQIQEITSEFDGVLAPGLTFDDALISALKEFDESGSSINHAAQLVSKPAMSSPVIWGSITMGRRARAALFVVRHLIGYQNNMIEEKYFEDKRIFWGKPQPPKWFEEDVWYDVLGAIFGTDDVMKIAMWEMATSHPSLGPNGMGCNDDVKAFFHFLLRRHAKNENVTFMKGLIAAWKVTPFFARGDLTPSQRKASLEKNECLALAQGHLLHPVYVNGTYNVVSKKPKVLNRSW